MDSLTAEQLRKIELNKKAAIIRKGGQRKTEFKNAPTTSHNQFLLKTSTLKSNSNLNTVSANFQIIAADRFIVNMTYHAPSIELFKTIPGKIYDSISRKWTFPLTEYDGLVNKMRKTTPGISLNLVPKSVIDTLKSTTKVESDIDLSKIDKELLDRLMPFQKEGVCFGVSQHGRCLIADDMGLGKTIEALGVAHYFKDNWPLLIICPSSMRFPWEEAIHTFLPSVNPFHVNVMMSSKDMIDEAQVVISSYDLMKSCLDVLKRKMCGVVILDESHFLKNQKSARTKATLQLVQKARRVILLSGTPALSRPQELYPQIYAIDPHAFRTFHEFGVRYCDGKKTKFGWNFAGSSNMEELEIFLKRRLMIRRLKSEVIAQLPSKLRKLVVLHPNMVKTVSKQMNDLARKLQSQTGMEKRGTLLTYYCATGTAKLDAVCEYVTDKLECQNKFLVFAHHSYVLNGISNLLLSKNVDFMRIDGATSADARKAQCDKFQTEETCRVAVLSIKAANSGITLTAAQLVIFAELYWNPGELTQAEDRAHRIGQHDSVVVEYLVAKGTADEHLWELVQSKLNVLNRVGLSKDNFRDTDTEHVVDKHQPTITAMFNTFEEQPLTNSEEQKHLDSMDAFFQDQPDDEDFFSSVNLDQIENEYQVETKKQKIV